jgi:O-antigen/teichoic acid export membrane protein
VRRLLADRGAPAVRSELSVSFAWLVLAALASQALANSTPVLVRLLGAGRDVATAQFFATLLVARIPLFLFAAVQAVLLPGLSRALAAGDREGFRTSLRRVAVAVAAFGLASVLAGAAAGIPVVRLVFGPGYALGRTDLVLLAAGTAVFIAANVQGQAALALGQHRRVAASWTLGCVVGIGLALVPGALSTRVEWSFLAGSLVVAVLLTATVRASVAQWRTRPATTNSL